MTESSSSASDSSRDQAEEFLTAASRLFETARPWLAAALAEHSAHPEGEPGACRLCALGGAVSRHIEPFAVEASRSFGQFADEVLADLLRLAEELLGSARVAAAAVAADYFSTVAGGPATAPSDGAGPASSDGAGPASSDGAGPGASHGAAPGSGYERIDIRLGDDAP